jgi:hypothetical protein
VGRLAPQNREEVTLPPNHRRTLDKLFFTPFQNGPIMLFWNLNFLLKND